MECAARAAHSNGGGYAASHASALHAAHAAHATAAEFAARVVALEARQGKRRADAEIAREAAARDF